MALETSGEWVSVLFLTFRSWGVLMDGELSMNFLMKRAGDVGK